MVEVSTSMSTVAETCRWAVSVGRRSSISDASRRAASAGCRSSPPSAASSDAAIWPSMTISDRRQQPLRLGIRLEHIASQCCDALADREPPCDRVLERSKIGCQR